MNKKIPVLHIVLSLDPGGMENGVVNLINGLKTDDLDVKVCCLNRAGSFASRLPADKQPIVLGKQPGFSWETVRKLSSVIRAHRPAILHTHNLGTLIYTILARPWGKDWPVLHGEHAEFAASDLTLKRRLQRRYFYNRVDWLVPVSDSLGKHLIEHGVPPEKIYAINNGVDTRKYSPGDRAAAKLKLGLPEKSAVIGMVGRFGTFKRHEMLVHAFEKLAHQNQSVNLLLVGGGGPEESRVRQVVAASPVQDRIMLAGFQDEPAPYYQAMDLLAVPSLKEGMSNAALEAMATEVPVLCHTSCGHADIIKDGQNGYVRSLNSVDDLQRILTELLQNPSGLRAVGVAGREYVDRNLSLARMRERYAELYRETARSRRLV